MELGVILLVALATTVAGRVDLSTGTPEDSFQVPVRQSVEPGPRVVGGQVAAPHSFPYQALLVYHPYGSNYCGGSLVDSQWVLTAAHCVDLVKEYPMQVILGVHNLSQMDGSEVNLTSTEFYIHPGWNRQNISNDIALIKLPSKVQYNENIQPVRLPARSQVTENFTNDEATVSGWGWANQSAMEPSPVLRYVTVTVMSNEACSKIFHKVRDTNLCTTGAGGKNPCYGDSGGPLALKGADGRWTQIGVVSYGSNWGCEAGRPAAYTRVSSYLRWISDIADIADIAA
ncbi:chymotrypsin BI-like [Bacillus rossius redtenbacheri]|uniref:chymotrypsin BI-like n=1 Tax=Bacillus rossius redtenbacheri TaxID=93214 RepID=UPI002FDD79D6